MDSEVEHGDTVRPPAATWRQAIAAGPSPFAGCPTESAAPTLGQPHGLTETARAAVEPQLEGALKPGHDGDPRIDGAACPDRSGLGYSWQGGRIPANVTT